jgi:hypothetical protein
MRLDRNRCADAAAGTGDQPGLAVEACAVRLPSPLSAAQANTTEAMEEARVEEQAGEGSEHPCGAA